MSRPSPRSWWAPLVLACVSLLPHLPVVLFGLAYYFRDFTLTFYPLRALQARELASGRWPFWNPYVNEGTFLLVAAYPLDLLHVFWPGPAAVSRLLVLHFPIAALAAYALARNLGISRIGAFVAGSVYALGGLALSSLNLYVFLQALALAPLVALTLRRAALEGGRWIATAALVVGLSLSTLAVEFVGQAILLGLALALVAHRAGIWRALGGVALGACLAGVPVALVAGLLPETPRAAGFASATALAYEAHPFTLLQAVFPDLLGAAGAPLERWWGGRFFGGGFPYFASLYVGPLALALALAGGEEVDRRVRRLLLALGALGLWYAIGSWGGLSPLVSSLPILRSFRFPSKALLLPYLSLALLAGFGAARLARGFGWGRLLGALAALAALAVALAAALLAAPGAIQDWLAITPAIGLTMARALQADCARVAALCVAGTIAALAVRSGRLSPVRAAALLAGLTGAELALVARDLNPVTTPAFFAELPEMKALGLDQLDGGRVFSYGVQYSPRMRALLDLHRPGVGLWGFFANRQMLFPFNNVLDGVETAEGADRTSLLAQAPVLGEGDYDPRGVSRILPALREAAVTRVLSLDPLDHPALRLIARVPVGAQDLGIYAYALERPRPRRYVACRVRTARDAAEAAEWARAAEDDSPPGVVLEGPAPQATCSGGDVRLLSSVPGLERYAASSDGPGYLVTRDSFARGWTATVDGDPAAVLRAGGRHRAVPLPGGAHQVVLRYRPPGLRLGLVLTALGALATAALLAPSRAPKRDARLLYDPRS